MPALYSRLARIAYPLIAAALLLGSRAGQAQQRSAALPAPWRAAALASPVGPAVRGDEPRRDWRWLGTVIGAAALGLAAGLEARAACGNSERGPRNCTPVTVGVGALGAAVGGVIGNLVGRAFKRG
jgi:hypothetical protein